MYTYTNNVQAYNCCICVHIYVYIYKLWMNTLMYKYTTNVQVYNCYVCIYIYMCVCIYINCAWICIYV